MKVNLEIRDAGHRDMPLLQNHFAPAVPHEGAKLSLRKNKYAAKRINYRVTEVEYLLVEDDAGEDSVIVYVTRVD